MTDTLVRVEVRGAIRELFRSTDSLTISGPAGTGKSLGALFWLHMMLLKYPGTRALVVRKVAKSLTGTTLTTYREKVAQEALQAGIVHFYGGSGSEPAAFRYQNGSRVVVGGLDEPQKLMGAEVSIILIDEAIETTPRDINMLRTRLRGATSSAYQHYRMVLLTNPGPPTHHLKTRDDIRLLYSKHEDNPSLYQDGVWTQEGLRYKAELELLTGVERQRLRDGRWVAAEGVIYEFDPAVHLVDRFEVPDDWDVLNGVDFGFTNPFSWIEAAVDPDGRIYVTREIYKTKVTVDVHARRIKELRARRPSAIVCDHQAENRAVLARELGQETTAAHKTVSDGIQAVQRRLKPAEDGKPRLFVMRDTLDRVDESLADEGKPTQLVEEFSTYVWDARKEAPVKADDHALDNLRYLCAHLDLAPVREVTRVGMFSW